MKTETIERTVGHTPGPWRSMPFGKDSTTGFPGESIYGPDDIRVGEVLFMRKRDTAQHEANARLIATAPQLLAACELAERAFSQPPGTSPTREHEALLALRAAIAKAKL